ncbi:MAG TPA: hypothetical protein VFB74_34100 [Kribbellaceae bacterium]|nr:hypothetical protein [Kribbellaceae bacterium]
MTKQTGLGDNCYVGGYDVSGDTQSLQRIGGGPAALDLTAIDKSAYERLGGLRDGGIDWTSYFDKAAAASHIAYRALPTVDTQVMYLRGTTLGNPAAALVGKQVNYDGNRQTDGSLLFTLQALANGYGLEWGVNMTAGKRTDGAAANGTGVDFGGSTAFGLQAYLQVFAFTGTSVTVKIQESSDNAVGDPYADVVGASFTAVAAAPAFQRVQTARALTVERWLRVVTTGVFSNAVFAVVVVKNATAVTFES